MKSQITALLLTTTLWQSITCAPQNVVLLLIDDFRPVIKELGDSLAVTPNIDLLIRRSGLVFPNTFAQQSVCAPSRNSLLTSRRPDTLRLYDFSSYWRNSTGNFTTLPQHLKTHGYKTYSVGKVFHPGSTSNFTDDYPYSWTAPTYHPASEKYMNHQVCVDYDLKLKRNLFCPVDISTQPLGTLPDIETMLEAKRILNTMQIQSETPFFLAVGLHKPHIPFRFPNKYLKYHPIDKFHRNDDVTHIPYGLPTVAWNPFNDIRSRDDVKRLNVSFPFGPIPQDYRAKIRQGYYAAVTYMDELVGQIMQSINFNDTIVVLTADHGWSLGEHAEWAKYSNFDAALRVPLVISAPGMHQNANNPIINTTPVELVDIFPTIVDLLKLPPVMPCGWLDDMLCTDGKSLLNLIRGTGGGGALNKNYAAFSQYPRPSSYPTVKPNSDKPNLSEISIMGYSVRTERFRYTRWIEFNPKTFERNWTNCFGEELYDHSIDHGENLNLIDRSLMGHIKEMLLSLLIGKFGKFK